MTTTAETAAPAQLTGQLGQVLLATLASTVGFWAWMSIAPLQKTYATELGLSEGQISLMLATPVLVGALGRVVVGALTDRFGHRATITIGIAILVVSLVIGALWPDDTGSIIASLILLGVGWSFMNVAGSALFSTAVSDQMRAASQGGVDALSNLFGAAAALIAGPIMVATNFSVLSVLSMVALVPVTVLMLGRSHF